MAARLRRAGIAAADGFALNVSNYRTDPELVAYARRLGRWHDAIDASRNGQGPWSGEQDRCNPPGRGLGERPTSATNIPRLDAYLWIKTPGESGGGPPAGRWFPAQAADLIRDANPPLP